MPFCRLGAGASSRRPTRGPRNKAEPLSRVQLVITWLLTEKRSLDVWMFAKLTILEHCLTLIYLAPGSKIWIWTGLLQTWQAYQLAGYSNTG